MIIDPKATKADLVKIIQDLRDEATGYHAEAKRLQDKLDWQAKVVVTKVETASDNHPWIFAAVAFTAGLAVAWLISI